MPTPQNKLTRWGQSILDWIFPRNCVWTEKPVEPESPYRYLCVQAAHLALPIEPPLCTRCGAPLEGVTTSRHGCATCDDESFHFEETRSAYRYRGPLRALIRNLKYQDGAAMKADLRRLLSANPGFLNFLEHSVIVPVPITKKRYEQRGYNQADLICEVLLTLDIPGLSVQSLLVRRETRESQTRLSRRLRKRNVATAFHPNPHALVQPDTRYVILDDVFTTGATASSCAHALKKAGAQRVAVATVCRG